MRKKLLILSTILFLFCSNSVLADEAVQIELSASDNEVSVGDTFQISVQQKNASTGNLNLEDFNIPGVENFSQRGSSQSTKVQIINGASTAITETTLTLVALKEGEFNIGPVEINSNNVMVKSNFITIKVNKNSKKSFFDSGGNNMPAKLNTKNNNNKTIKNWLVNGSAFLLLCGLIAAFYKQKQKTQLDIVSKTKNSESSDECKINLPDKEDEKFFLKAKESILLFIKNKYEIDTEALTSQEVIEEMKMKDVRNLEMIIKTLNICDQGNFARNDSGKEELLKIINKIN